MQLYYFINFNKANWNSKIRSTLLKSVAWVLIPKWLFRNHQILLAHLSMLERQLYKIAKKSIFFFIEVN
jgi:hypothetical protein